MAEITIRHDMILIIYNNKNIIIIVMIDLQSFGGAPRVLRSWRAGSCVAAYRSGARSHAALLRDRRHAAMVRGPSGRTWSHWPLSDKLYTLPAAAARKQNGNRAVARGSPRERRGPAWLTGWRGTVGRARRGRATCRAANTAVGLLCSRAGWSRSRPSASGTSSASPARAAARRSRA